MRTTSLVCALCLLGSESGAQQAVVPAGGEGSGQGGTVSWTIGQVADLMVEGGGGTVGAGVQQPFEALPTTVDAERAPIGPTVWPTITNDVVHVDLGDPAARSVRMIILDEAGRPVLEQRAQQAVAEVRLAALAVGRYILHLVKDGRPVGTFDLIRSPGP